MSRHELSAEQEQEAKLLEARIRTAVDQEISDLARLLVSKPEAELVKPNFRSAISCCALAPKLFRNTCAEKKRLPRFFSSVPWLSAGGGVSRLPPAQTAQHSWSHFTSPRLLLLPSLRWTVPLG